MDWTRIVVDNTFGSLIGIYWYRQGLKDGRAGK